MADYIIEQYTEQTSKIIDIFMRESQISKDETRDLVSSKAEEVIKRTPCQLVNNYTRKSVNTDMVNLLNWYNKKNPIACEHGCFFKRHDEAVNLNAAFVNSFLTERKKFKKLMFQAIEDHDDEKAAFYNVNQKVQKIFANSYYGAQGQSSSIFYNIYTALSITGKGQSIISCAATTFEMFLCNNIKFKNNDECLEFISNVVHEDKSLNINNYIDRDITRKELFTRLGNQYKEKKDFVDNQKMIKVLLTKLTQDEINRIYYKNNLYEFSANSKVFELIRNVVDNDVNFLDPNEVPEELQENVDKYWELLKEFVYYDYPVYDRVNWLKTQERMTVITVDTDSNFLNLEPFYNFVVERIPSIQSDNMNKTFKICNLISYILKCVITASYWTFTTNCNVPEEKRPIIAMKNEFFMPRILLTSNKKNYASRVLLQEGKVLPPHKQLDIKGLSIKKSNTNRNTSKFLQGLLQNEILFSDTINTRYILQQLAELEDMIRQSFLNGETTFMSPDKANEIESYKVPLQQASVRAAMTYNFINPENPITFPAQLNTVKVNMSKLEDIVGLYDTYPEIYKALKENIFDDEQLAHYGVTYFALPKTDTHLPEWIIPYICVEDIVRDNIKNFLKILESIGLHTISVTKDNLYHSNIIEF